MQVRSSTCQSELTGVICPGQDLHTHSTALPVA